jgi:PAS domain S-box-containing protein
VTDIAPDVGTQWRSDTNEQFRLIVDSLPGLVFTTKANGELDWVNRAILAYFGRSLDDLRAWQMTDSIHPDDLPNTLAEWQRGVASGQPYEFEQRLRRHDEVYRWFHFRATPLRDEQGRLIQWCGLVTDIDDLKRAQEASGASEQGLRLLVDTIPGLISITTPEGVVEQVNRPVFDYFGRTLEELQRWGTNDAVHPDDRPGTIAAWRHSVATGVPFDNEHRLRRADGAYRWFQARSLPLRDSDGRVVRWYMLITDIDERKNSEARLQASQEALRNSQRKLSSAMQIATVAELSASIAHEIYQPLAAVVASGHACQNWLSMEPPNIKLARAAAERIIRDGNATADVVIRIRALFKQAAPDVVALDVNGIIGEVITLMADEIREHGIRVESNLAGGLPPVPADRVQMQQALINLIRNAIEAMGGVTGPAKTLALSTRQRGDEILIHVRDHGCGIPHPEMIFEAFYTTKGSGMGMGLAICRTIVEAHGGHLSATSHEADGTTFTVAIPVKPDRLEATRRSE